MQFAFWEWMIRGDGNLHEEPTYGLGSERPIMREGKLKSTYGPYRARDLFNAPPNREDGPIWTFDRMGATRSQLPNGRVACVGGEHEDFYDPDFCIYSDLVVFDGDEIEIYGYPKEIFPPTDFHTATSVGDRLIIIGGLGYKNERIPGYTPVYALDLSDFHMENFQTSGEMPGWIHEHESRIDDTGTITVRSGEVVRDHQGDQVFVDNFEDYALNLNSRTWRRTTNRNWYQAKISRNDGHVFPLKPYSKAEALLPRAIPHTLLNCEWREAKLLIENVEVSMRVGITNIKIVVKGHLSEELLARLLEEIQMNAQTLMRCKCSVQLL
jgi:hypothetical protein